MNVKSIARWAVLVPLFIIPFLSLYVDNTLFFPFITGKNFAFRMLVEIAFFGWIILAFADAKYRPRFSWTLVLFGAFTAWMFVADLFAVNPHKALWSNFERMDGWVTLIHLFFFFLVAGTVFAADKLWRKWWLAFLAATALVSGYALLQLFHLTAIHQGSVRLDASLGNSEYLAGYFLFAIAVSLWQAFETKEKRSRWLRYALFALAAVQTVVLIGTGTRGTFVGLIGALGFGALLWLLQSGKNGRRGAAVVIAALIVVVGGLFAVRNEPFIMNSPILSRFATISVEQLSPRFAIWNMAIKGIEERPITGWGQEGFNYVFSKFYDPALYGQEPWFDRAHNVYLDWTIAGGIPALLLFLATFLTVAWALFRSSVSRAERIMLLSAFVAYAIQGLVVFDNLFTYLPLVAIFALAHGIRSKPIAALDSAPNVPEATLATVVLPVSFVAMLVVLWFVNVPSITAGKDLILGLTPSADTATRLQYLQKASDEGFATQEGTEQILQFAGQSAASAQITQDQKQQIVSLAAQEANQELARAPQDARLHLEVAVFYRSIGDLADAKKESALAHQYSPTKQAIIIEQGVEQLQDNDFAGARQTLDAAYALDTAYDDAATYSAAGHIMSGDIAGGKKILTDHFGTTSIDQNILVVAYYQVKDWQDLFDELTLHAKNAGDAASSFQLAAAYAEDGQTAKAIQVVKDTMAAHPESAAQGAAYITQLQSGK